MQKTPMYVLINQQGSLEEREREAKWIEAAQANISAFEPLYLHYREPIYRYLRTRLKSEEEAADLTQQVFLAAMRGLPRYKQRGVPFSVWLFRIARNQAINVSNSRFSTVAWDALPELLDSSEQTNPEAHAELQQRLQYVKTWLAGLKQDKRELLALRFAAGLTVPQIAEIIGKRPDAVKKQLSRLLQAFKEDTTVLKNEFKRTHGEVDMYAQ